MTNIRTTPPKKQDVESTLIGLYQRHSVVEELIRCLELYQTSAGAMNPPRMSVTSQLSGLRASHVAS